MLEGSNVLELDALKLGTGSSSRLSNTNAGMGCQRGEFGDETIEFGVRGKRVWQCLDIVATLEILRLGLPAGAAYSDKGIVPAGHAARKAESAEVVNNPVETRSHKQH